MRTLLYGSLAAALLVSWTVPAHAERDPWSGAPIKPDKDRMTPSPITDRFAVRGTFFNPAISSSIRVDTQSPAPGVPGITGTTLSGERDFGMTDRNPMGRFEVIFRLRERNRLRVDYFETNRRGDRVLTRPIQLGANLFEVNDEVTSRLDWRQFGLTYTYSLVRTDRIEVGFGLAVHFLEAEAQGEVVAKQLRQEVSGAGAFPTIPLDVTWRVSRRFSVVARGQYFHTSVNNFDGSMGEYHGDFQFRWTPNFTVGAGYTTMRTSLAIKNDAHFPGAFHLDVRGPEGFFKVSF
jgi:hypothetical protein